MRLEDIPMSATMTMSLNPGQNLVALAWGIGFASLACFITLMLAETFTDHLGWAYAKTRFEWFRVVAALIFSAAVPAAVGVPSTWVLAGWTGLLSYVLMTIVLVWLLGNEEWRVHRRSRRGTVLIRSRTR
jgi:hypothetical protein